MPITPLPTPVPSRADPATFAARGDAFLAALPTFATEANATAAEVNANTAICQSAAQTVNVTAWVSGFSYADGANVYDPVTFLTYRRKGAGSGSTRPALDGANWRLLTGFGDVDSVSAQNIGGVKTFDVSPLVPTSAAKTSDTSAASTAFVDRLRGLLTSTTTGTAVLSDRGCGIHISAGFTIPSAVFAARDTFTIYNNSGAAISLVQGASLTLRQAGTANTGNRTLAQRGLATVYFVSATEAVISGAGIT